MHLARSGQPVVCSPTECRIRSSGLAWPIQLLQRFNEHHAMTHRGWCTAATPLASNVTQSAPRNHVIVVGNDDGHRRWGCERAALLTEDRLRLLSDKRRRGRLITAYSRPGGVLDVEWLTRVRTGLQCHGQRCFCFGG